MNQVSILKLLYLDIYYSYIARKLSKYLVIPKSYWLPFIHADKLCMERIWHRIPVNA